MPSIPQLSITITSSNPNPNGATALVSAGGSVRWKGADSTYSLTLPTSTFPDVTNPVNVPRNNWTGWITVSSSANGTANYTIDPSSEGLPEDGQPSIMVQP